MSVRAELEAATGVEARRQLNAAVERHRAGPLALTLDRRHLGPYRGYAEQLSALAQLHDRGARLAVVGRSVGDEPLFALELGEAGATRTTVTLSGLHPLEWIGIESHLALLDQLLDEPLRERRLVAFPLMNPDGVIDVERNLRRRVRRVVRHNRRKVDLNRNWPAFWGGRSLAQRVGARLFAGGRAPASEPEVAAVIRSLEGARVDRAASLHSFGGAVLYPYGGRWRRCADSEQQERWARAIAERAAPRAYRAAQASRWLPGSKAAGMELDWFAEAHGAIALLVECSRGGLLPEADSVAPAWKLLKAARHLPPLAKVREPFAWYNPPRPDQVAPPIAAALEPFVRGEPVPAG